MHKSGILQKVITVDAFYIKTGFSSKQWISSVKGIVNLTPVRVAHSRRKDAKKSLDCKFTLGVFAALRETRFELRP